MSLSCASSALRDDLRRVDDLVADARQSGLLPADGPSLVDSISPGDPVPADRAAAPDVRRLLEAPLDADAAVKVAILNGSPGPFSYIDMGGMFTLIKVRAPGQSAEGWYEYPRGTVAGPASRERMARDGITDF